VTAFVKRVLAPIRVEAIPPEYRRWIVFDTFEYRLGSPDGPEYVRIERGFETDFASIPRGLWNVFPPAGGSYMPAALIHDCLYKTGYVLNINTGEKRFIERSEADKTLRDVMEVCGTGWITRQLIYTAVRIGGRGAWANHRKEDDEDTVETVG
jgi:hypothetical protein